jgi:hypothetical protein
MRTIVALLFLLLSFSISAQNIEVTTGALYNKYFDIEQDYGYKSYSFQSAYGFAVNVGYERKFEWLPLRFTLGYENYGGAIIASDFGHMYSNSVDFEIRKSMLTLGIYFINFSFFDHLDLNIGLQFNRLLDESVKGSGESRVYSDSPVPTITVLNYEGQKSNTGLRGRLAYDFDLNDRFAISPQYDFYYGLSNESEDFPSTIRSYRHYISIGLQMNVGK